jgi:HAE1 family hydrophobic/amphiphilic exporter-1
MSLPEFSIKRPVTVLMACLVCILLGGISFVEIPVDLMPEIDQPTLSINIDYPGVAPEEIETLISRPLEQIVSSAPGVERVTSTSSEGRSSVRVEFVYGTDIDVATDEVRSRMDRGRRTLPDDIEPPFIYKFDVSQFPIMFLTAASADYGPKELRTFVDKNILYRLERVPGVGQVSANGGLRREIHVDLDLEKLRALDLSVDQVVDRIRSENLNRPVGPVKEGRFELLLRTSGEYESLDQILNVALTSRDGVPVYVRDVAAVEDSHEDIRFYVAVNGVEGLRIIISKQSGANTVKVSEGVWDEVAAIERDYPNIQIDKTMDTADFIMVAIDNVKSAALAGSALAVIVLLVFLRSFSSTLIIGVAIPISVISTFALMYFNGFTLNTVSFGGLALGVGMLVDNAIVVLENIYRHREDGTPLKEAAILGSNEVAMAITASTLTTIAVFVPVVFMGGYSAQTFQQLAYVVSFSLLCSLAAGLTVVPALCSKMLRGSKAQSNDAAFIRKMGDGYGHVIEWALDHRLIVTGVAVGSFALAMWLVPLLGVELQPQVDEGTLRVDVELESGTNAATTKQVIDRMYSIVKEEVPEAVYVMTEAGQNSPFRGVSQHVGELRIMLNNSSERDRSAADVANSIRPLLMSVVPGSLVRTRVDSGNFGRRGGSDSSDRLSIEIRGHNPEITAGLAEEVQSVMMRTPGVVEAQISRQPGLPEMVVKIDRLKSASMGMTVASVADTLETAVGGRRASFYREEGDEYDIVVRLREEDRLAASQIGDIPIRTPTGQLITADQVVRTQRMEGPTQIDRIDQERIVFVSGAIADRDLGSIVDDLQASLDEIPRPAGYEFKMGGEYEEQVKAFNDLLFACILAFILVYMVMAAQFESLRDPFIIIFSIPLAAIGVVLTLLLTNTTFNMQGFLGVIILVGIVVNNAIVLVDYANQLRRDHGYGVRDAVVTAGARRLRPILMTTATTVLGLVPMSLGIGEGSELQVPMARVVIGGLMTSTLITLIFIPVVYAALEEREERATARRTRPEVQPATGD